MKTIYNIAKAELQNLFFSPIAWLILIIFTFQTGITFSDAVTGLARSVSLDYPISDLTSVLFSGWDSIFTTTQGYLYLYIPLLTMNLMCREYSSGSIKLLYSSPVTNPQIVLGKFLSMMIYALILTLVLFIFVVYGMLTVENLDLEQVFSGLLGIYLLICAYSAIGLFMSSLTSYQVVAAIGTLTVLSVLNFVQGWWQDIAFVREITYWLSMTGRSSKLVRGLICTDDIIYFLVVISLFVSMTIIALQSKRQKCSVGKTLGRYAIVWLIVVAVGYTSSRPQLMSYYDATRFKKNTLTPPSVEILKKLKGGLTITNYSNLLDKYFWVTAPTRIVEDRVFFEQYFRFKPEIKMKYVYYWDSAFNPEFDKHNKGLTDQQKFEKLLKINQYDADMFLSPEQIKEKIDLSGENNRFVRVLETDDGRKAFLRVFDDNMIFPYEAEISAAMKRLVMDLPTVGFVTGHDERNIVNYGDRDYSMVTQVKSFRHSLVNQGFDFTQVNLENVIPKEVTILVMAEMKTGLTPQERINLDEYIARGGNLFIISEPGRQDIMNPIVEEFGVKFMPGCLVSPTPDFSADLILAKATKEGAELVHHFKEIRVNDYIVTMPSATGLEYTTDKGFEVIPMFRTDSVGCWNELETNDFIDKKATYNPEAGEVEKSHITSLALKRKMGDKDQKIVIVGDADCISNSELSRSRANIRAFNYYMITGSFYWLSDGEVPIDIRRPRSIDNKIFVSETGAKITEIFFVWGLSGAMFLFAIFLWLRRRGR